MKTLLKIALFWLLSFSALAENTHQPLDVDQAFQFSLMAKDDQTLIAEWTIAPGYYLYRDRIYFQAMNPEITQLSPALMPEGMIKTDPELGQYQVYKDKLKMVIPVVKNTDNFATLEIDYQGCSEYGYCYPPTEKVVRVNMQSDYLQLAQILNIDLAPTKAKSLNAQDKISTLLSSHNTLWVLLAFLGFGLLISLTPCCMPMFPILSSIIAGQKNLSRQHAFFLSLSYVLGMALTYALVGVVFGLLGKNLQTVLQLPAVTIAFSLLFVAMALSLFGLYELQLPMALRSRIQGVSDHQHRGTYMGAAIMGVLSTLILSPCVTAPLVGVLGFISNTGNMILGGTALFIMGLGMGAPLLLIGVTGHLFLKPGPWMNRIKQCLGLVMLGVAIYMLSRILSASLIVILWAALAIATGILLGALSSAPTRASKISKFFGLIFCVYGVALSVSAIAGNTNPLHPWVSEKVTENKLNFIPIKTVDDLKKQISLAQGKPVLVDFYADWCVACKAMDRLTFTKPLLQKELSSWVLLRADVTANDDQDKLLEKAYHVIAPPTLLFFNSKGQYLPEETIVGEVSAAELLETVEQVK